MFGKRHKRPKNRIDTLIGADTRIEGNVSFSGGLRVDGEINGNVIASSEKPSTLVLAESGRIKGNVTATHLLVNGTIDGHVSVTTEYLELQNKARVIADVHYKTLEIQLGAVVAGKLIHTTDAATDKVVAFKLNGAE